MEMIEMIQTLINQAGFPIAMCIILLLYVKKQQDDNTALMKEFMLTLQEYNRKLEILTEKINRLFGKEDV